MCKEPRAPESRLTSDPQWKSPGPFHQLHVRIAWELANSITGAQTTGARAPSPLSAGAPPREAASRWALSCPATPGSPGREVGMRMANGLSLSDPHLALLAPPDPKLLVKFLKAIPEGMLVLVASYDDPGTK